jgi:hypothetical protein
LLAWAPFSVVVVFSHSHPRSAFGPRFSTLFLPPFAHPILHSFSFALSPWTTTTVMTADSSLHQPKKPFKALTIAGSDSGGYDRDLWLS